MRLKQGLFNGDGDPWIKPDSGEDNVHFQPDPFHISHKVLKKITDEKQARRLNKLLKSGKVEESLKYLTNL